MRKKWLCLLAILALAVSAFPLTASADHSQEDSFRQVVVSDPVVEYVVRGKARVFEGIYHYRVKNGNKTITEGWGSTDEGGPAWGSFKQVLHLPKGEFAKKEDLTLELYEGSEKDGSEVHRLSLPLQEGSYTKENNGFKSIQINHPQVIYHVSGKARVFEGTYQYAVSDGHDYLVKGVGRASRGEPDWGKFEETIRIPVETMPVNGTLILELYVMDKKSGQPVYSHHVVMDQTPWQ